MNTELRIDIANRAVIPTISNILLFSGKLWTSKRLSKTKNARFYFNIGTT